MNKAAFDSTPRVSGLSFVGFGLVTGCMLMCEVLLTRIFSVALWYHMAFMVVSLSMFGLTVGALRVHLSTNARFKDPANTMELLAENSLLMGISLPISFGIFLTIPVDIIHTSWMTFVWLTLIFLLFAVPYYFGGIVTCLVFSRLTAFASKMYAVDLLGAAAGCLLVPFMLMLVDAPSAMIFTAGMACLGAVCFAASGRQTGVGQPNVRLTRTCTVTAIGLLVVAGLNGFLFNTAFAPIRLIWMKGQLNTLPLFERWNAFSCIRVDKVNSKRPFGWGLSSKLPPDITAEQLMLVIDDNAGTVLTRFDGDTKPVRYLKYELTNAAHYLRPDSRVFVIGAGGGRDILSALVFGQPKIVAADINDTTINRLLKDKYANFTGHLGSMPQVTLVCDEARAYLLSSEGKYDIIEASLIDTWAATTAGAFAMTENSVYTSDAWKMFLGKLTDRGVLTISRWYSPQTPEGSYKACALAVKALRSIGVTDPRRHIIMIYNRDRDTVEPIFNMIVSKSPFTPEDITRIQDLCKEMDFKILLTPLASADPMYDRLTAGDYERAIATFPSDISPPTDDRPFFFNLVRLSDFFNPTAVANDTAVRIIDSLLAAVALLIAACVILPLRRTSAALQNTSTFPLYFLALGFGYIVVEIAQIERLSIFLGHPTLGISVGLCSMLLFSGFGSLATNGVKNAALSRVGPIVLLACVIVLSAVNLATPAITVAFAQSSTFVRCVVAVVVLAPCAALMGTAFPIGLRASSQICPQASGWFWALNGAASVASSIIALALSLTLGIQATMWFGVICYLVALACFPRKLLALRAGELLEGA